MSEDLQASRDSGSYEQHWNGFVGDKPKSAQRSKPQPDPEMKLLDAESCD